jgi:hypothetical protein
MKTKLPAEISRNNAGSRGANKPVGTELVYQRDSPKHGGIG